MSTNAGLHEASSMKHDEKQMLPGQLGQAPAPAPAASGPGLLPKVDDVQLARQMANFLGFQVQSMTLKAVVVLGIPDILAKADGEKPLSAPEILAKLPTKSTPGPNSVSNLRRLMRPLVQRGVFSETLTSENQSAYGLTESPEWYIKQNDQSMAPPMAPRAGNMQSLPHLVTSRPDRPVSDPSTDHFKPLQAVLGSLHEVILDEDAIPFTVANGQNFWEYVQINREKHPETSHQRALCEKFMNQKNLFVVENTMDALQDSGWLEGVQTFVDVGGGRQGIAAGDIVARNPQIQAINFDLPYVLEGAPEVKVEEKVMTFYGHRQFKGMAVQVDYNGQSRVRHVKGDFFKEVPSGDAMFLKEIVHNHDDEACIRILKNCFNALPKGGKCIICEAFVKDFDSSPKGRLVAIRDIIMLGLFKGGRQRTLDESQTIMQAAGFSHFRVIESPTGLDLILGVKE